MKRSHTYSVTKTSAVHFSLHSQVQVNQCQNTHIAALPRQSNWSTTLAQFMGPWFFLALSYTDVFSENFIPFLGWRKGGTENHSFSENYSMTSLHVPL